MKSHLFHKKILLCLSAAAFINSYAQQEFTLTSTAANINSSRVLIDLPGLTGNPDAIIIATPLGNTKTMNPHPVGAWYYNGKWNVFNSDHAVMIAGLTYKIQYTTGSGPAQFLHLVTQLSLGAEGTYIDNPALNNKANAQFAIFQNHSPDIRMGSWLNQHEAKSGYSTTSGKWFITNVNGQPLQKGAAYNIMIYQGGGSVIIENPGPIKTVPPATTSDCKCPAALPPNGQATGDLAGMYPNPMVTKLLNRPLSNTPPVSGQVLKWNGTEWSPSNETGNAGNATTYTAGLGLSLNGTQFNTLSSTPMWNASQLVGRDIMTTAPTVGQVLKWGGGSWYPADDNVSTTGNVAYSAGGGVQLNGTEFTALYETPMWNANKLLGRDMVTTAPVTGQVLKWGGAAWLPADDNGAAAGTSNGWNSTGTTIFNTNTGNVGIGNHNPNYLLDISNRMRIRSGGNNSASAGLWLNNNANSEEVAFIGMEDDTHVGFYGKNGAGWKFTFNTQTGALKINGSEGTAGQVLTSNGAGAAPTWNQPSSPTGTGVQANFKRVTPYANECVVSLQTTGAYIMPGITHNIVIAKKSRVVVSANMRVLNQCLLCSAAKGFIQILANGVTVSGPDLYFEVASNADTYYNFHNYMFDLDPGTYKIEFKAVHQQGTPLFAVGENYSSLLIIPLQ